MSKVDITDNALTRGHCTNCLQIRQQLLSDPGFGHIHLCKIGCTKWLVFMKKNTFFNVLSFFCLWKFHHFAKYKYFCDVINLG